MKIGNGIWIFLAGCIAGVIFCFFSFFILSDLFSTIQPPNPKIAGSEVPSKIFEVDFSKRYNLILDSMGNHITYSNCLIKGFTQGKKESLSRGYYFDTWLVIELSDGRIVYIPPHNIAIIEESKP